MEKMRLPEIEWKPVSRAQLVAWMIFYALLLFYLAIPVVAGTRTLLGIASVALSFALIPQALESHHLSPFLLGGIGLIAGTIVGPGGLGGNLLDIIQKQKEVAILSAVGMVPAEMEPELDLTTPVPSPPVAASYAGSST